MLGYVGYPGSSPLQLSADLLTERSPRMGKKILIVIGIITVWECRDSIIPVAESVVTYVIATGSSLLQSV